MLFWIFVIILCLSAILWMFIHWCSDNANLTHENKVADWVYYHWHEEAVHYITIGIFAVSTFVVLIMSMFVIDAQVNKESYTQAVLQEYEVLTYELENIDYDNENDMGKKELYTQIKKYNSRVAEGKVDIENIWVRPFVTVDWRQVQLINLGGTHSVK